ncbi:MAG TPA: hypothetical protein VF101_06025 [Gaiellaceae bacterium]
MRTMILFGALPWRLRAIVFAALGSGLLYNLATGHHRWYWWFLAAAAWFGFVWVVVGRKSLP